MTTIKERILQISEAKGVTKENFFSRLDVTYATFRGSAKNGAINFDVLEKLFTLYPDVNPRWVHLGEGEMFLTGKEKELKTTEMMNTQEVFEQMKRQLESQEKMIEFLMKQIELNNQKFNGTR